MPRTKMYLHSENKGAERDMTLFVLRYLHEELGYEGKLGKEMNDVEGEDVEMSYVEIEVPDDWEANDVQFLANKVHRQLEPYLQQRYTYKAK